MAPGYQQLKLTLGDFSRERNLSKGKRGLEGPRGELDREWGMKDRGGEVEGRLALKDQLFTATAWLCLGTQGPNVLPRPRGPWTLGSSTDTLGAGAAFAASWFP